MLTGKEDLLQSIIEAFTMEKGTREFYQQAAIAVPEGPARNAFARLAGWEYEHMLYIQFLYQSLTEDRDLLSFEDFKKNVRPEAVEGGIPVKEAKQKLEKYDFKDASEALRLALEMEAKSYDFYRRLSDKSQDTNARLFMKEMMNWEKTHIEYLKKLKEAS